MTLLGMKSLLTLKQEIGCHYIECVLTQVFEQQCLFQNNHNRSIWELCIWGEKNPAPSDLGCMLCRRLTQVMAVTSLLLKSIDPIDHSFTNPLLLIPTVLSVFLSFTILPKFIFPYLYGLYCSCYSAVRSALLNEPSN